MSKSIKLNSFHTDRDGISIKNVSVLGNNEVESFVCNKKGLSVELKNKPENRLPLCLKIELE